VALFNKLDVNGDGQLTMQELAKAGQHHHGAKAGGLISSNSLGALLGGQESASAPSQGGGLMSDISAAVQKAMQGYFGTQQSTLA